MIIGLDRTYDSVHVLSGDDALHDFTYRDRETAYVSVNSETCWVKTGIRATEGAQVCGGHFKEQSFPVTGCNATLTATSGDTIPLTVRVWTDLDQAANDESFGIDNVVVKTIEAIPTTTVTTTPTTTVPTTITAATSSQKQQIVVTDDTPATGRCHRHTLVRALLNVTCMHADIDIQLYMHICLAIGARICELI